MLRFKDYFAEAYADHQTIGKIKMLVYGQTYIFFFEYNNNIYGGNEEARLIYSTMKKREKGADEMVFGANNLSSELEGKTQEEFFVFDDLKNITIIDNKHAEEILKYDFLRQDK